MAVQPGSTILFSAYIAGLSVFANGLLYALVAGLGYLALRGIQVAQSRPRF
jgi:hypothetical protein